MRIDVPAATIEAGAILAHVLIVDRFGNVQLNLTTEDLSSVGVEPGTRVEIEIGLQRFYACAASTFADVRIGDVVLYEDAYGNVALAINGGSAAEMLAAHPGDTLGDHRPRGRLNSPQRADFSSSPEHGMPENAAKWRMLGSHEDVHGAGAPAGTSSFSGLEVVGSPGSTRIALTGRHANERGEGGDMRSTSDRRRPPCHAGRSSHLRSARQAACSL